MRETHLEGYALDRYEIREYINEGGFGEVYRAWATDLRIEVAVKVLKPSQAQDPSNVARFGDEAHHMARLNHPNIIHVYSFGNCVGWHYIVMGLLEGMTLESALEGHTGLPPRQVVTIVGHIASGLDYAHARGRVHRDIKPANIFLTHDGAVLTDFGLAKQIERTPVTVTQTISGTPQYMAPEQITGEGISTRTDIYGLGLVAYEALTGFPAYPSPPDVNPWPTLKAKLEQDLPALQLGSVSPAVVKQVDQVLRTAAARSPEARYASAGEFAAALARALEAIPNGNGRKKLPWLALAAMLAVLGIAACATASFAAYRIIVTSASSTPTPQTAPAELTLVAMNATLAAGTDVAATKTATAETAVPATTEPPPPTATSPPTATPQPTAIPQPTATPQPTLTSTPDVVTNVEFFETNHRGQTDVTMPEGDECAGLTWVVTGQPTDCEFERLGYGRISVPCSSGNNEPFKDKCFATMGGGSKEQTMQYRFHFRRPDDTLVTRGVDIHRFQEE